MENLQVKVLVPHNSTAQFLWGASIFKTSNSYYLDAEYIFAEAGTSVTALIGENWKYHWVVSTPVFINTQTGTGKNFFVGKKILPEILRYNRLHRDGRQFKILILSNRVALNVQNKLSYAKIIDHNSGANSQKYSEIFENLSEIEKNNFCDFGNVHIMSYQQIFFTIRMQKTLSLEYDFAIFDEAHFFVQDSVFNPHTEILMQKIISATQNAVRIYTSATLEEVLQPIMDVEVANRKKRPLEKDRPFGYYTEELFEKAEPFFVIPPSDDGVFHRKFSYSTQNGQLRPYWGKSAVIYDIERDYSYIDVKILKIGNGKKTYEKYSDLIEKIKATSSEEKWVIFTDSKDSGEALARFLLDNEITAAFVCSETKNDSRGSYKTFNHIVKFSNFEERVLVTTSVLDNGVNFHDEKIRHIVIFTMDRIAFLQMLGRVRRAVNSYDEWRLNLYLPEFDVTQIANLLKRDFKELLKRLNFDTMNSFEKAMLLERNLSGTGLGLKNPFTDNLMYNDLAKIKLSESIEREKNFVRFFQPDYEIEFSEDSNLAQIHADVKNFYDDKIQSDEFRLDFKVRTLQKVLSLNVMPTTEPLRLSPMLLEEVNSQKVEEEIIKIFQEADSRNDDSVDFISYSYAMRFLKMTEQRAVLEADLKNSLYYSGDYNDRKIRAEISRIKNKQEKFLKLFNYTNKARSSTPNSPLWERLLWLEMIDNSIEEVLPDSLEGKLSELKSCLQKFTVSEDEIEKILSNELTVAEHDEFIAKNGLKPKSETEDLWELLKEVSESFVGCEIKQISKLNEFFIKIKVPYEFVKVQMRGKSTGKETRWLIKTTN